MWFPVGVIIPGETLNVEKRSFRFSISNKDERSIDFFGLTTKLFALKTGRTGYKRLSGFKTPLFIGSDVNADLRDSKLTKFWMKIEMEDEDIVLYRYSEEKMSDSLLDTKGKGEEGDEDDEQENEKEGEDEEKVDDRTAE